MMRLFPQLQVVLLHIIFRQRPSDAFCIHQKLRCLPSTTRIDAFKSWFGGGDDNEDDKQEKSDEYLTSANLGNVASVIDSMSNFKKSQRIEERTSNVIKDLSTAMVTGESSDGKVKITFNGQMKPMGVDIDPEYFQALKAKEEGSAQLCAAIQQALVDVSERSTRKAEEKMKGIYQDIGLDS